MNPTDAKMQAKNTILAVLQKHDAAKLSTLKAEIRLNIGFGDKVVDRLFADMEEVGYIIVSGDEVAITEKGKGIEVKT